MQSYPMKKLIIIFGLHIDRVQTRSAVDNLLKVLSEKKFTLTQSIPELSIDVYSCPDFSDHTKLTHVVIGFSNEISEIRYYTTELK